ncbi:MAG: ATP-dependent Clp protease proteolytic subunit [Planctomycetes bacterium]|nr:ATP-dependent Clp protease proteolytic subunit [Planctomycetota bacterium]
MPSRKAARRPPHDEAPQGPPEIAIVGDLTETESAIVEKLLEVERGAPCTLYFDSDGGSAYVGLALMSLIRYRRLQATGIVVGTCSSAALWPFAACQRRLVFPHSVLLFHPMKWQSGENVDLSEATEWARHFADLERDMDDLLAALFGVGREQIDRWNRPGRHLTGREFAATGLAQLVDLLDPRRPIPSSPPATPASRERPRAGRT